MHRLLVSSEQLASDSPLLPKEAANHLKVVRPKDGEEIELFDGRGRWRKFRVKVESRGFSLLASAPTESSPRPPWTLALFACVTKGSRWDWTIEKATELGATRIVPVVSARTIVRINAGERAAKRERWTRIAEDAARQSDAKWIPEVCEPVAFAESLVLARETTCFAGALTTPPPRPLLSALLDALQSRSPAFAKAAEGKPFPIPRALSVYVGPEGDFTPDELAALLEVATPVSFGSTILRAETAAIYGLSVLKSALSALAQVAI